MAFEKKFDQPEEVTAEPCIHLRNKGMYITGEIDSERPDEAGGRFCWCNQTQHAMGPDRKEVDRPLCVPGRECYQLTY